MFLSGLRLGGTIRAYAQPADHYGMSPRMAQAPPVKWGGLTVKKAGGQPPRLLRCSHTPVLRLAQCFGAGPCAGPFRPVIVHGRVLIHRWIVIHWGIVIHWWIVIHWRVALIAPIVRHGHYRNWGEGPAHMATG